MTEPMDEKQFDLLADRTLSALVEALGEMEDEGFEADLESGVLTIAFDSGGKFVVNSHRAARQIWMAAGASAWHFDPVDGRWVGTKGGEDLLDLLEAKLSERLGQPLRLPR
ncbi:MAG: iron donor protein CyaY [Deltaproteobacteria bacterium]|nr:iron donor protein CyaY [Deltaproteobacteria bacterium]